MKIAIYYSGFTRTLKHVVNQNIKVIRDNVGECEIHTFYSFWDVTDQPVKLQDDWYMPIPEYGFDDDSDNKFVSIESQDEIDKWFRESGSDYVDGEIESIDISKKVMEKTKFIQNPNLSSQYYKIHRVAEKYSPKEFDFCLRIRGDVVINSFPDREDLEDVLSNYDSLLLINEYVWPGGVSNIGGFVNEMVWFSTSNIFLDTCSVYLSDSEYVLNNPTCDGQIFGEIVTGRHFEKLVELKHYAYFNFNHRSLRFTKK